MAFAWYGYLRFSRFNWFHNLVLTGVILISWGVALFEYSFQVSANRIGYADYGGTFYL